MKRIVMALISFVAFSLTGLPAAADSDRMFAAKFLNYKIKNKLSALQTAETLANRYKKSPEQMISRFIRSQFEQPKHPDLAIVYGIEAFREQGLTHEQALTKVSDLIGQLPETVEAMNNTSRFKAGSTKKRLASR